MIPDSGHDLISMADIARLAGQSRATVGNWKSRNSEDFPPERGRGTRGPLYSRSEVAAWLAAANRLDSRHSDTAPLWALADRLRGVLTLEDALPFVLLLLGIIAEGSQSDRQRITSTSPEELDATIRSIGRSLFPFAEQLVPRDPLPGYALAEAVAMLSDVDRSDATVLADTLFDQSGNAIGHRGGGAFTPVAIRKLMVAIADPVGVVYIPALGVGQLMVDVATTASSALEISGQEMNARTLAMAQVNLALHHVSARLALGDVFAEDRFPQLQADRVLCTPPWGQRLPELERLKEDPRWVWGEPGPNDTNTAWIQHCLYHLADNGRAVITLPNSALFESGRASRIRQRIIKAGLLEAVLSLPPGLFASTSVPFSILVLAKGRPQLGKPPSTLMVDLASATDPRGSRSGELGDDQINEAANLYRRWVGGHEPSSSIAAVADFDAIAGNDFVIDPGRYLSLLSTPPDLDQAAIKRSALLDRLATLTESSRLADDQLKAILGARP